MPVFFAEPSANIASPVASLEVFVSSLPAGASENTVGVLVFLNAIDLSVTSVLPGVSASSLKFLAC